MGGFWAVSRYDDVVSIARASERFNNSGGPQFGTGRPPLEVDRPEHTFYRRVLQPYFGRERVAQLEPAVRGFVAEMLEPALAAGEADLAETLSYPLPARTLCLWLGLPDEEWAGLKAISEELFAAEEGRGNDPAARARCNDALYEYSRAPRPRAHRAAAGSRDRSHLRHLRRHRRSERGHRGELHRADPAAAHGRSQLDDRRDRQLAPADRGRARDPEAPSRRARADPARDRGVPAPRDAGAGHAALGQRRARAARPPGRGGRSADADVGGREPRSRALRRSPIAA